MFHYFLWGLFIVVSDLFLSGDNALVIAMAIRNILDEALKKKAAKIGVWVAIGLRVGLTMCATSLMNLPGLKFVGGLALLWVCYKLADEHAPKEGKAVDRLFQAVKLIVIADLSTSIDNIFAIGGSAHGNVWLVIFGLALSIPILMVGSQKIANVLNKAPWLVPIGSGVLAFIAGGLLVSEPFYQHYLPKMVEIIVQIVAAVTMAAITWWKMRKEDTEVEEFVSNQ